MEDVQVGSYAHLARDWRVGDTIELSLPMPVRYLEAHPYVTENTGRVALLYCVEGTDPDPRDLVLSRTPSLTAEHRPDLLGGVTVLTGQAERLEPDTWNGVLYRAAGEAVPTTAATLTAIPYFAWANREPGPMLVWLRRPG